VRLRPLTRLRLAFFALGAVLLTPLAFLLVAIEGRVEAQRRLRHEVVAERIFDELERELTAVIEAESARPSAAYDEPTRSETWAPFVVGYFKVGAAGLELLARDQLDSARTARLSGVLSALSAPPSGRRLGQLAPALAPAIQESAVVAAPVVAAAPERQFAAKSTPDVLQKLNRGQESRIQRKAAAPTASGSKSKQQDPMMGF
jgi:hypothetical protein